MAYRQIITMVALAGTLTLLLRRMFPLSSSRLIDSWVNSSPEVSPFVATEEGVFFQRNWTTFPESASFVTVLDGDHCLSKDIYGDNTCLYKWGDQVIGDFVIAYDRVFHSQDYAIMRFKIDRFIPFAIKCQLCGADCGINIPQIKFQYTIEMPPCPLSVKEFAQHLDTQLSEESPTKGVVAISIEGELEIMDGLEKKIIAQAHVEATIK